MKHLYLALLSLLLCQTMSYAEEVSITISDNVYIIYNISSTVQDGNTATVKGINDPNYSGAINIPGTITFNEIDYNVTRIVQYAFKNCTNLTSVTLPNTLTNIEQYAFNGCSSLTAINIPDNLQSIDKGVFDGCTSLTNITLPSSISKLDEHAFRNCSNLTVTLLSTTPPSCTDSSFHSAVKIRVPVDALEAYKAAEGWSTFLDKIEKSYSINLSSNNETMGSVSGVANGKTDLSVLYKGDIATLTATANEGYKFVMWNDNVTTARREVTIADEDITLEAIFDIDESTGISNKKVSNLVSIEYFSLLGLKSSSPKPGVNIVIRKYADGKTEISKLVVK